MISPTIHLNGTSADDLLQQHTDALVALRAARNVLAAACPHGRDYYPQGNGVIAQALDAHRHRMAALDAIIADLETVARAIVDQRSTKPPIARAFPDYDIATLPPIPAAWRDTSWRNDACPSWQTPGSLFVYVDYANEADRECQGGTRFTVQQDDPETGVTTLLATDNWADVLALVGATR